MRTRTISVRTIALAAILSILVLLAGPLLNGPGEEVRAQSASADYFLKIEGIEGESTHDLHRGEIEIESWSWGETNSTRPVGAGAGTGKVVMRDFTFTMRASKATPKLFLAGAQGKVIPSATLTAVRPNGGDYIVWELKDVIVSGFSTGDEGTSDTPMDELKLRFTQILVTYSQQNADGTVSTVKAGWDLAQNKKV